MNIRFVNLHPWADPNSSLVKATFELCTCDLDHDLYTYLSLSIDLADSITTGFLISNRFVGIYLFGFGVQLWYNNKKRYVKNIKHKVMRRLNNYLRRIG